MREWYLLLRIILVRFGCKKCPHELTLYYWERGEDILLINTSTDDFLCAFSIVEIFHELRDFVTKFFDVTTQEGPILKYLNLCIVQSQYDISFDQAEHIRNTILDPLLKNPKERVKGFHNPCQQTGQPNKKSLKRCQLVLKNSKSSNVNLEAIMCCYQWQVYAYHGVVLSRHGICNNV